VIKLQAFLILIIFSLIPKLVLAQATEFHGVYTTSTFAQNACKAFIPTTTNSYCDTSPHPSLLVPGVGAAYALQIGPGQGYMNNGNTLSGTRIGHYWQVAACPTGTTEDENGFCAPDEPEECLATDPPRYKVISAPGIAYQPVAAYCASECRYEYDATLFDESGVTEIYTPAGEACTGEEPYDDLDEEEPDESDPPCYLLGGVFICFDEDGNKSCYENDMGELGDFVFCPGALPSEDDGDQGYCGFAAAGIYTCFKREQGQCGQVNGLPVCFAKTGDGNQGRTPIGQTSPDHPQNGGNADGDPTNDLYQDETDVTTNGLTEDEIRIERQRRGLSNLQDAASQGYSDGPGGLGDSTTGGTGGTPGTGEEGEGGLNCEEQPEIAACEDTSVLDGVVGDLTDQTAELTTFLDDVQAGIEDYIPGDGPAFVGQPGTCPFYDVFTPVDAFVDTENVQEIICDTTGGIVHDLMIFLGLFLAAGILLKGLAGVSI